MPLLQQAAELGESDALAYLGAAFMEGWAVAKDEAKAVAYLRLAARRDHADALNDLAAALASGTGCLVDKAQAAELFRVFDVDRSGFISLDDLGLVAGRACADAMVQFALGRRSLSRAA